MDTKTNTNGTISLPSMTAVALWNNEFLGQMSDGYWENARPHDHWRFWVGMKAVYGELCVTSLMTNRCTKTNYNFEALIRDGGDRMRATGRMVRAGANADDKDVLSAAEYMPATLEEWTERKANNRWEQAYVGKYMAFVTPERARRFYSSKYSAHDLREDCRLVTKAVRSLHQG